MFQPKRYSSSFQYSHSVVMPNEPKIPESEVISMPMRPQIEQEQLNKEHKKKYKPAENLKLKLYKKMKTDEKGKKPTPHVPACFFKTRNMQWCPLIFITHIYFCFIVNKKICHVQ